MQNPRRLQLKATSLSWPQSPQARLPTAWVRQLVERNASRLSASGADPALVDVMLDKAIADGFVVRDGEFLLSKLEMSNGVVKANGKVISPGDGGPGLVAPPPRR